MTKREIAEMLVNEPNWGGSRSVDFLCKRYTKQELQDALDAILGCWE